MNKLWNSNTPEEEFLNLFIKLSTHLLSNVQNIKSKNIKSCLLAILAMVAHKYNQSVNVSSALMEYLYKYEHVAVTVAELLQLMVSQYKNNEVVGDFMREIGKMEPSSNKSDATGAKNISVFIVSAAELMPTVVLPFVSLIIPHLADDVNNLFTFFLILVK